MLHPGNDEFFSCAPVFFDPAAVVVGMPGELSFRVNFWSTLERIHHFETRVHFGVEEIKPEEIVVSWLAPTPASLS